jgi:hypothetical protein
MAKQLHRNGVRISLHPSGHILGAAQVRLEQADRVWVVTGDFKRQADPTCLPFEPLRCHGLIMESTFGLPIFRWPEPGLDPINRWWAQNRRNNKTSLLFAYSLGKAQRIMAGLESIAPIYLHGAVATVNRVYARSRHRPAGRFLCERGVRSSPFRRRPGRGAAFRPITPRGPGASSGPNAPLPRAGCRFAATGGGVIWSAVLSFPIMLIGMDCWLP